MTKKYVLFCLILGCYLQSISQSYPKNDFVAPLNIPLYLAGVFGECRATHFHAGIDIKTNQVEGLPIFSIGDGYVSRIKVSAFGYGNALYITHPNGYTSVYGHLQSFREDIARYVKQKQYEQETFEIDICPLNHELKCKKGEQVAKSGNTGGSSGPHLHFEIRDSFENTINPQLFGIKIIDNIAPTVTGIAIYNQGKDRFNTVPIILSTKLKSTYFAPYKDTVLLNSDAISFGLEAVDKMNNSTGNNGLYEVELKIDDISYYKFQMNKFHFDETRNVLAYIDQKIKSMFSRNFQRCYTLPNQYFTPQKNKNINRGIYYLDDEACHLVTIYVKDFQQNTSLLKFYVKKDYASTAYKNLSYPYLRVIYPNKDYSYEMGDVSMKIGTKALFDTTYINIQKTNSNSISDVYTIGKATDDFMVPIELGLRVKNIPSSLLDKVILLEKSSGTKNCGGIYENGFVVGKTKSFGLFSLAIDTTAPKITPINITSNKIMTKESAIKIAMADNLSGIKYYDGFIDGHWVLFENSGSVLRYKFDMPMTNTTHDLKLEVIDERSNKAVYSVKFIY